MPSVLLAPLAEWPHLQGLALADPEFHKPQPVDMILGEDILMDIIRDGIVRGKPGTPTAINSVFGYLLGGKVNFTPNVSTPRHACFTSFDNDNLQKFWELESVPEMRSYTPEEKLCESFFQKTHTRDETGRYVVALPFKPDAPPLGESRQIALARFHKLEYRLERNPQLKADYHACLQEYVDLNHMELADDEPPASASYYLPHHCVSKISETTRTRVVYDAGCRTTSGHSLNDALLTGPKLHLDIVDVLLKFRVHNIAFCSDIKQMYRNILVREIDRDFQRILWRQSPEEPLRDYRLRTVTFGVSSSPYLALRTIKQLAYDEAKHFPLASPVLLNDVFVDDVVTGADTTAEALALQQELIGLGRVTANLAWVCFPRFAYAPRAYLVKLHAIFADHSTFALINRLYSISGVDGVVSISINCNRVQSGFKIAVPPSVKALLLWYAKTTCHRYSGGSRAFMLSIRALIKLFVS
ncbi:uncharacterized protein LOC133525819 [Cydia pomonella]|uniref:uncharacterized protein LOC133525819 n=1 Tax=Cydia pomonella TaxID=82600 RepID=UPI002ADD66D9|nr:uncharacterized protein LOC133525819 [Cydia pomonella]